MGISARSMMIAGVSLLTASAVAVAPVDVAAAAPTARTVAVDLASAQKPITARPVTPEPITNEAAMLSALLTPQAQSSQAQSSSGGPVVAAAAAGVMSAGSNLMDLYFAALPWVQWGFEFATWAAGWVPIVGFFSGQIMVAFYTGEPVVQSWFQSTAYALDLNFGPIPSTLVNGLVSGANAFIQNEIAWLTGFFPPFPPFPPIPGAMAATTAAAPDSPGLDAQAIAANPIVTVSDLVARLAAGAVNTWYPASGLVGNGVGLTSGLLNAFGFVPGVPVANFALNEFWGLVQAQGNAATGFANDLISISNALVATSFSQGIAPALDGAVRSALQSVQTRGGESATALANFSLDQLQYLTGLWVPHTVNPGVNLPQGPANAVGYGVPQVLRDLLGPLAPLLGPGTISVATVDAPAKSTAATTETTTPVDESTTAVDQNATAVDEAGTQVDKRPTKIIASEPVEAEKPATDAAVVTETTTDSTAEATEPAEDGADVPAPADRASKTTRTGADDAGSKTKRDKISTDKADKSDTDSTNSGSRNRDKAERPSKADSAASRDKSDKNN
ncbi:MAG: hypothetical protein WBB07_28630 [Mycobacterium sp.]